MRIPWTAGGTPPQQLCTPVQPSPPGELRARPPCPLPPRVSVHTAGGGSRSEIALDTSCEVIPTGGLSGRASAGPWGTGEVASAAELSGPRHGLVAALVYSPWWVGWACPQPLDGEGARNGDPAFNSQSSTGCRCFLTHHAPEPSMCICMHVCVCGCARTCACASVWSGEGCQGKAGSGPPSTPATAGSPAQGRPHPGCQGWSGVSETLRDETRRLGRAWNPAISNQRLLIRQR